MQNLILDLAKFFGTLLGAAVAAIMWVSKFLGDKQSKSHKEIAERLTRLEENVTWLREKVEEGKDDFKERLKEITDYMYNRPR